MTPTETAPSPLDDLKPARPWVRAVLALAVLGLIAFWVWAFAFASREAVNRIDDRAWAERAETICLSATVERFELTDLRRIDQAGPELIRQRADIVDASTDILEQMLDDIVAIEPVDEKGRDVVPLWEAEYRTYLGDRRAFASNLRDTGDNLPFYETAVDGLPISERLATFAGDNEMSTCSPPIDLTR